MQLEHTFTVPADVETVWRAVLDPERVAPCMPGATLTEVDGSTFSGSVKVKLGPISLLYKGSGEFLETDESARKVVIKASGKDARGAGTAAATVTVTLRPDGEETVGSVVTDLSVTGKPAQFGRGMISEVGGKILDSFAQCLASKLAPADEAATAEVATGTPATDAAKPEPEAEADPAATAEVARAAAEPPDTTADTGPAAKPAEQPAAKPAEQPAAKPADEPAATPARPRLAAVEPETEAIDLLSYAGPSVLKRAAPLLAALFAVLVVVALRRRTR